VGRDQKKLKIEQQTGALGFVCALVSLVAAGATIAAPAQAIVLEAIRGDQNHLFIPVSVAGTRETYWLVDTGSPTSGILESVARAAKLSPPSTGSGIPPKVPLEGKKTPVVMTPNLVSEKFDFGGQPLAFFPGDTLRRERSRMIGSSFRIGGIVGLSTLARHSAIINERHRQLFVGPNAEPLPVTGQGYEQMGFTAIPLRLTGAHHLEAVGTIGGKEYSFLIDTGAPSTVLSEQIRRETRVPFMETNIQLLGIHDFKRARLAFGKVPGFRLGNFDLGAATISFADLNITGAEFSRPFGGIIGTEILWDYYSIIDLGHRELYLHPQSPPPPR
jgi:hypothetical protein